MLFIHDFLHTVVNKSPSVYRKEIRWHGHLMFCFSLGKFWPQEEEGEIKTSDLRFKRHAPQPIVPPLGFRDPNVSL